MPSCTARCSRLSPRALVGMLSVLVCASPAAADEPVSLRRDVMAVLSKAGCNQGACHGNLNGRGGFRLSLRGQDPTFDHVALTRDTAGRRTNTHHPADSLVVRKPAGLEPHEGG